MSDWSGLLAGKRAVVTAGGSGIGAEIARTLSAAGARVAVCDVNGDGFDTMEATGDAAFTAIADVSDFDQVAQFFGAATDALGGLDILVNNAGIAGPNGPLEEMDPAEWDRTIRVDLNSAFYCARQAIPHIVATGSGSIVNIASSAAFFGYPLRSPYAAAKWGLIGLTKTMAMELGPRGVRVNAICPGSVNGERIRRVMAAEADSRGIDIAEVETGYTRQVSLRSFVEKQDVANMVLFLVSPLGARISGQTLGVDGHTETLAQF
ncbi:MAG: SDR family oxidoreductase [Alphaproteobacteria bacterium]|nr:MAG: SDR family oxidoreductase [Alphaproteobacteria bacterium]